MPEEELEQQTSAPFDIHRYLDLVRRRHLYFLLPFLLGWLMVWSASWVLPPRYKSSTLILVEQPTVPKNYVMPNVSDNLQDGLQSITQQILSRTRLLLIIDRFNLYKGKDRQLSPDEKVERMRKDIDIEVVRSPQDESINSFNISYSSGDPRVSQQVTRELSKLFISGNLEARQRASEGTTQFLETQLQNASASLAAQDEAIRKFKGEYIGELPTQQISNLQILSGLQAQLQNEEDALGTAKQQHIYLQTVIDQYRALQGTTVGGGAPTGLTAIDQELTSEKSKLADLQSRYTDQYPEVQAMKATIARTEKTRDALLAGLNKKGGAGSQASGSAALSIPVDPSQNSPLLQFEGQLQANRLEIANREKSIDHLKASVNEYQARLNAEPAREQQLDDLTRGYQQSKANYDDLLKKESESKMATSMEQTQQGERFTILDPANLPLKPDSPNRLKFCGLGLGAGLLLGFVVVGGLEFMDDRMHSEKEIKELLPVPIISEIPEIVAPSDKRRGRRRAFLGWATAALVVATVLAGSAFSYLHN